MSCSSVSTAVLQPGKMPPLSYSQAHVVASSRSSITSSQNTGSPLPQFGIAFDVDGVVLRGREPIGGSRRALQRLFDDSGTMKIPFLFLTNGGGVPESRRALELSKLLGVNILPSQFCLPLSCADCARAFFFQESIGKVLCDILRSGGLPGQKDGVPPPLYFAADDLEYQAAFPVRRLGIGSFRIALESIFNRVHHTPLECIVFGKPKTFVFKNAESILRQLYAACYMDDDIQDGSLCFRALYMIGDNPFVDIKGARQAGHPWISILTRTGVFQGEGNHTDYPADLVVDTVECAVDYILEKEFSYKSY